MSQTTIEQKPKIDIAGLSYLELSELLSQYNEPAFRSKQLFQSLYKHLIQDFNEITEFSKTLRTQLKNNYKTSSIQLKQIFESIDGTKRYLFTLEGGELIETVWIPELNRATICISSQAGCPLGCKFCLTAQMGLKRNLSTSEILNQILFVIRNEKGRDFSPQSINIVLMGMGEPLLNYENVLQAIQIISDNNGLNINPRNITLSTAGVVPRIYDLAKENIRPELAISISAPNNEIRSQLMPINSRYPLESLMKACKEYPLRPNEFITFEYVLLNEVNDKDEHAYQLLKILAPLRARNTAKVNLIPHNSTSDLPFISSSQERIKNFQRILRQKDLPTFIRKPRGRDILSACGQLAAAELT